MGAVAVLGGIWEIVSFRADGAGPVGPREGQPGGAAGLRGGKPEACGAVASGMRFQRGCRPVAVRTRGDHPARAHRWAVAVGSRGL